MVPPSTELLPSAAPSSVHHFVATPPLEAEAAADLGDHVAHGRGVGGVAVIDLHGERAAIGVA